MDDLSLFLVEEGREWSRPIIPRSASSALVCSGEDEARVQGVAAAVEAEAIVIAADAGFVERMCRTRAIRLLNDL